jgi:hypothetical protein
LRSCQAELQRSAARLLDYEFDALLLCDGQPLPAGDATQEVRAWS